jgi:hypothetical protein
MRSLDIGKPPRGRVKESDNLLDPFGPNGLLKPFGIQKWPLKQLDQTLVIPAAVFLLLHDLRVSHELLKGPIVQLHRDLELDLLDLALPSSHRVVYRVCTAPDVLHGSWL